MHIGTVTAAAIAIGLLAPASRLPAQDHEHDVHQTGEAVQVRAGTVHFPSSANAAARPAFTRGIALLHSFDYDDAASAFQAAERADSAFALPYWFEAATHSPILWGIDDAPAARAVLARLGPSPAARLARARTARERAYGAAIEALYADTDLTTRIHGYADSLRALARRDPADLEAAAFASIAQQMYLYQYVTGPRPADFDARMTEAIALAERVFEANPRHPGAAHYLIHASDLDPRFASRALTAARAYARIAPDVEHAQHMPSHVFIRLGLWDDQVASNERAWKASIAEVRRDHAPNSRLDFHDFLWLQWGYLQQGRWHAARALVDSARRLLVDADSGSALDVDAHYVVPMLQWAYAMETGRWDDGPSGEPARDLVGGPATAARERNFMRTANVGRAFTAVMHGDAPAWIDSVAPGSAIIARRARLTIDAGRAERRGDTTTAIDRWRAAAALEDSMPPVGPPSLVAAHARLAALLLASRRAREAVQEAGQALRLTPNRTLTLVILARARAAAGDSTGSAAAYRRALANWHAADADLPPLDEVRRGTGRRRERGAPGAP